MGHEPNVYAWSRLLNRVGDPRVPILRRYYYTSVMGDTQRQDEIHDRLKKLGIEAPRVFKKEKSTGVSTCCKRRGSVDPATWRG